MKTVLFVILLLPAAAFAQYGEFPMPVDGATRKVVYQAVTKVEGTSAGELHRWARRWLYDIKKSPKWCIRVDDPLTGTLIADVHLGYSYYTDLGAPLQSFIDARLKIESKNGRYRYTLANLEYSDNQEKVSGRWAIETLLITTRRQRKLVEGLDGEIRKMLAGLTKAMTPETGEEDW